MSVSFQHINTTNKSKVSFFDVYRILEDEWNALLTGNQFKIASVVLRRTYGWQKTYDKISISQFQKFTGLSKNTVIKGLNDLIDMGIVGKFKTGEIGKQECYYYLIFDEDSNISYGLHNCTTPGYITEHTIEIPKKEIKKGRKKGASPSTPPPPLFLKDQVKIKQSLYDALVAEYTEPIVAMAIDRMNAYMEKTGRYKQYKCHGAKLRHWLTQDADQYAAKLRKQTQEMESQREYARWLEAQEQRKIEKQKQEQLQADQEKALIQKHMPIVQKYMQQFPHAVKMSKYIHNGICEVVDPSNTTHYVMMTQTDFEPQLTRRLSEFGYSHRLCERVDKMPVSMRIQGDSG